MTDSRIYAAFIENEGIIKKFLRRYSSNHHDIDDISQETILRALHAEQNREIQDPRAFLFGVARNIMFKELDRKSKSLVDFIEGFDSQHYAAEETPLEDDLAARQRMLIFWRAVNTLPPQCQKVFVLKKVHGYSHKEIAKLLKISVSTVEKYVASGLKRCSEYMENRLQGNSQGKLLKLRLPKLVEQSS